MALLANASKIERKRGAMINLINFCSKEDPVFAAESMKEPFSDEKYTYATNGSYIIRVPLVEEYKDNRAGFDWSAIQFPDDHTDPSPYVRVPDFRIPEQVSCGTCLGLGTVNPCPDCDEDGGITFQKGFHDYECECKECDGQGYVKGDKLSCPFCDGEGFNYKFEYEEEEGIEVGDHYLSKALLLKLRNLPLFAIRKYQTGVMNGCVAHFVFFGGDGMLMQRRRELD